MNTYLKGRLAEREVEKLLQINGFVQTYKAPHVRFSKCHDLWNAWDIISIRDDLVRCYFQVKTNPSHYYTAKKKLMAWVKMFGIPTEEYILLLYQGKRKVRKFDCATGREVPVNFVN